MDPNQVMMMLQALQGQQGQGGQSAFQPPPPDMGNGQQASLGNNLPPPNMYDAMMTQPPQPQPYSPF